MGICQIELVYALVIMLGPMTFGTIMCYPSPAGPKIREAHGLDDDALQWSFYNSVSSLFAIAGPFVCSGLLKLTHDSRKKTVFIIAICGTIFWLLNLLTKVHIWAGIVIRAFLGIVMGMYSSVSPMYLVEIAPSDASGFFGCLNQIGIVIGMVFFDFIGPSLSYMEMCYVGAAVTALQAITVWFIMESPAVHSDQQQKNNQKDKSEAAHRESLWQKKYMGGLFSGILMMLLQQFCGINAILTNLADLMNESGLDIDGNYQGGIASCAQLIAVFVGGLIMDKLGRKIVWMISCSVIVVFLLIFGLNVKYDWSTVLPLVCIFLYQLGFGLGMGPIPWFIIPEYFNDDVRSTATTIVSASNWVFSFIIIFVWPAMKKGMGMFWSLMFFMFVTVGSIIFGLFCVHEPLKDEEENEISSGSDRPDAL
ncbi:major facilitator superfamily transporter [Tritrichomonas foetus]|uniref:Major facilitator superfamily transporter n=1 Tax=Tritrichomonas foetus TaxID=1144522 RepID=A0A1J4J192_9EUKA|nr:major facilitator superfamily transporter [Tritrichomonas foetus]|eukprot:OHS93366.1 major facilitator superfamily transporter [Tritrichomonas foetus]